MQIPDLYEKLLELYFWIRDASGYETLAKGEDKIKDLTFTRSGKRFRVKVIISRE